MLTKQHPVGSGFGPATTAKETLHGVDLTGTIAIVAGGYAGIGLETTRALAGVGDAVIVLVRAPEKAHNALSGIPRVEQARIDLLNPEFRFMSEDSLAAMGIADVEPNGAVPAGRSVDEGGTLKTTEQGVATSVWSAISPKLANLGGVYCEDVEVAELRDQESPEQRGVAPWAIDSNNAKRLWGLSERLCAVELAG